MFSPLVSEHFILRNFILHFSLNDIYIQTHISLTTFDILYITYIV